MIQQHISLQAYNTLAIPAVAERFITVDTIEELQKALSLAACSNWPVTFLGGGSNVVLPDSLQGLVIVINLQGISVDADTNDSVYLSAAAGENWHDLVMHCVSNQWHGIENLALIPGSVGAAPIQNIGAYGVELSDHFEYLEAIHITTGNVRRFSRAECEFAYRDSIFKQALKDQYVIVRVVLHLSKMPQLNLSYPALQQALTDKTHVTIDDVAKAVIAIRRAKLPDPKTLPNAGSFFKNPIVYEEDYQQLKQHHPNIVAFPYGQSQYKLAAAWLIEQAGWKGRWVDNIVMHEHQALVLTNPNCCPQSLLLSFVKQLQNDIYQHYGLHLEIEPRVYT